VKQAFGLSIPETVEEICTPSRCALIVYDMQRGIVPQIADGDAITSRCQQLLAAARQRGFRVFFTRHMFLPSSTSGVGQLRRAMIWQGKNDPAETKAFITQGSASWEIVSALSPRQDEVILDKITMSAFESTFLNLAMRDAHLEAFMIAGIALEIGIEPTVRQGLDLNYVPILVADACGSRTEEVKERSLATLRETGEVVQVNTAEVVSLMNR
jgi:nicotinamidase-related amidase